MVALCRAKLAETMDGIGIPSRNAQPLPVAALSFGKPTCAMQIGRLPQNIRNRSALADGAKVQTVSSLDCHATDAPLIRAEGVFVGLIAAQEIIFGHFVIDGMANAIGVQH